MRQLSLVMGFLLALSLANISAAMRFPAMSYDPQLGPPGGLGIAVSQMAAKKNHDCPMQAGCPPGQLDCNTNPRVSYQVPTSNVDGSQ